MTQTSIVGWSISRYLPQRKSICKSVGYTAIKILSSRSNGDMLGRSDPTPGGIIKVIGRVAERPKVDMMNGSHT